MSMPPAIDLRIGVTRRIGAAVEVWPAGAADASESSEQHLNTSLFLSPVLGLSLWVT
ncbi:hypothetical protein [Streptosporangium sp. NPDC002721]|uniref:hypothetical protein n=1 Tax=Streptosporangium sp. NPDC002721 TaxID=3366188 RepID=UPI00367762C9